MRELSFDGVIYAPEVVQAAVALYQPYAEIEIREGEGRTDVSVRASSDARARRIAGELMNQALGRTIELRGTR